MTIAIREVTTHETPLRTRFPFRYGIAALTEAPYLILRVEAEVDGKRTTGLAADLLPPKWFTKDPHTRYEDDADDMRRIIRHAADLAIGCGRCESVFALWRQVYQEQAHWAKQTTYPPLLWNFGVTLVERAAIDAHCRATDACFARALRDNTLGIDLGQVHEELAGHQPADHLPARPATQMTVRHTVGLGDPLRDADIPDAERVDDGLPQSLEANIRAYGLTHFKIKIAGKPEEDAARLAQIAELLHERVGPACRFTLDGNEQFQTMADFRAAWSGFEANAALKEFLSTGLLFVEQPVHRRAALDDATGSALAQWPDRPPIIIDESDATAGDLPRALSLGYAGTSHKNCKGVFKGVANACLLDVRRQASQPAAILSGEDLGNVGPVALLQDLAVAASLGIRHVERNGHHYFRGLTGFPTADQQRVLADHADLYAAHDAGFPTLAINGGEIAIESVLAAPFGYRRQPEATLARR